jgi:CBS domain containing-hemolysin-like protein
VDIALSLLAGLLLIAVIIAANGYFVAQEFSYMAVDRSRLKAMAAEGDKGAERTLRITERTSFMLSGAQLGITVTGLLVGYVAEPLVGSAIGELLGGAGVPTAVGVAVGTIGVLVLATFTQMLFGELFPKNLAIAKPLPVATRLSASTWVYMRSLGWLIAVFDAASNALLRVLRIEPVHDVEHSANLHDLQRIVSLSRDAGELPPELSLVLDRMLDFPERNVGHALVPRARVDTVSEDTTLGEVLRTMEGGHSRYPVLDDQGDVVGVVHLIDVLQALEDGIGTTREDGSPHGRPEDRSVREVSRPATVVPTLMLLPEALTTMTEAGDQIACAIDEYGGLAGIVTVEDLAEEVVGELTDEHDEDVTPHLTSAGERAWTVRGDAPLDEVEREIGVTLPRGEYHTVAGLVIAARGALPQPGECVEVALPADPLELAHDEHPPRRSLRATVRDVARYVPTDLELELAEQTTDTLGAS